MIFSVTYYLELRYAIIVYYAYHFLVNKGRMGCLIIREHQHLYLVNDILIVNIYRNV